MGEPEPRPTFANFLPVEQAVKVASAVRKGRR